MSHNARAFMVDPDGSRMHEPGACAFVRLSGTGKDDPPDGIVHACPCGCRKLTALWFKGRGQGRAEWTVTGEWPNVTLAPSIGIHGDTPGPPYHWHGYLKDGIFVEC